MSTKGFYPGTTTVIFGGGNLRQILCSRLIKAQSPSYDTYCRSGPCIMNHNPLAVQELKRVVQ